MSVDALLNTVKNFGQDLTETRSNIVEIFKKPSVLIVSTIIFIIFFLVSLYIYFKYIHNKIYPEYVDNREFISQEEDKIVVLWFYTQWCPYCKSTYNEWEGFKNDVNLKKFPIKVEFREINCEIDVHIADKYNIKEYPSIRLLYRDEVHIYDARPDRMELMVFLNGSMPEKNVIDDTINNVTPS